MKLRILTQGMTIAVLTALLSLGCSSRPTGDAGGDSKKKGGHHHDHPEKGPHGGPLAEWGDEEYHPELVLDAEKKTATVYILDGEVKKAVPIEATSIKLTLKIESPPVTIELKAEPQKDDPAGKASRFSATHEKFGSKLDPEKIVASGKVKGKPYQGSFHVHDEDPPEDEFKTQPKP